MIDHATFQVLDDVTTALSSGKENWLHSRLFACFGGARGAVLRLPPGLLRLALPWPDHRSMSYRTKETLS